MSKKRLLYLPVALLSLFGLAAAGWWLLGPRPSNDRPWSPDQERLTTVEVDGDAVTVHNVRNTTYRSTEDFDVHWEERRYDLRELDSVWFVVEPFSEGAQTAHTLLSFGFGDEYLAVSVEIRKEVGESFSVLSGMLRQFELMYVFGDEHDLIGLRANHRQDPVFVYPMKASPEAIRALFLDMTSRANELAAEPAFYNTLTANCTTTLVDHVNKLAPDTIPSWSSRVLLPGNSDELVWELGLIDSELPFPEVRERHRINDAAAAWADAPDFSLRIREGLGG